MSVTDTKVDVVLNVHKLSQFSRILADGTLKIVLNLVCFVHGSSLDNELCEVDLADPTQRRV